MCGRSLRKLQGRPCGTSPIGILTPASRPLVPLSMASSLKVQRNSRRSHSPPTITLGMTCFSWATRFRRRLAKLYKIKERNDVRSIRRRWGYLYSGTTYLTYLGRAFRYIRSCNMEGLRFQNLGMVYWCNAFSQKIRLFPTPPHHILFHSILQRCSSLPLHCNPTTALEAGGLHLKRNEGGRYVGSACSLLEISSKFIS